MNIKANIPNVAKAADNSSTAAIERRSISQAQGTIESCFEFALKLAEPMFLPASIYTDDRGWSIMNQLQGVLRPAGQINYSVQYPGVVKAWHKHAKQTDFWICLKGNLKVGVYCEERSVVWERVFGERAPGVIVIPPGLWHGAAAVGNAEAGLMYYVDYAYNPESPDEDRRPWDSVPGHTWDIRHG
jgi:dTDP-4-dehydrorhamnose 3,5-epimerase